MPGYQDPVIMAAGTFVEGATIELSADVRCGLHLPSLSKAASHISMLSACWKRL